MTIDIRRFLPADLREPFAARVERQQERIAAMSDSGRAPWYSIRNLASTNSADIYIFDEIGFWGVTAADFVTELMALQVSTINLHINSPGGEVFDGIAIHSALAAHPATVDVYIDGMAASVASVIAMSGNTITAVKGSMMMIHDASGVCFGNSADMLATATLLDRLSDVIAGFYADRAGGDAADWRALMRAETWYTGPEAVAAKLADRLVGAEPEAAPSEPAEGDGMADHMTDSFDVKTYGYRGPSNVDDLHMIDDGGHAGASGLEIEWAFDADAFRAAMIDGVRAGRRPDEDNFTFDADVFRNAVREARN